MTTLKIQAAYTALALRNMAVLLRQDERIPAQFAAALEGHAGDLERAVKVTKCA